MASRLRRLSLGVSILLASSWLSWIVATTLGVDTVGSVAVSSVVGFIGGFLCRSGFSKRVI